MPRPEDDKDDDKTLDEARSRLIEKNKPREGREPPKDPDTREVKVDLDEDDDEPQRGESAEARLTREEKKRQRGRDAYRERDEMARQLQETRERLARIEGAQSVRREEPKDDPLEKEESALRAERQAIHDTWQQMQAAGTWTDEQWAKLNPRYEQLTERLKDIEYERRSKKNAPQGQQMDPQAAAYDAILRTKYPDVFNERDGARFVAIEWQKVVAKAARNGHPNPNHDFALVEQAFENVREELGLKPARRAAPSPQERREYSGMPSGPRGGERPTTITLSKEQQVMAKKLYPDAEPAEAYKRWAKGPGRKLLAMGDK